MSIEDMLQSLTANGLVPCAHNLVMWQCADGDQWGAAIWSAYEQYNAEVLGDSLRDALEKLMVLVNRGADIQKP